jgi:hypothetical protein
MPARKVGTYNLGLTTVDLICNASASGGSFDMGRHEIVVGLDHEEWQDVVAVLAHESMEWALVELDCRMRPSCDHASDNGAYCFFATHTQFSEASARAARFMASALPDLAREYRRAAK